MNASELDVLCRSTTWWSSSRPGGELVADGRIPTQALLSAIEADGATDEEGA